MYRMIYIRVANLMHCIGDDILSDYGSYQLLSDEGMLS